MAEVIFTSEGHKYLHLPGVIMTQAQSQTRYLLSDGLGSIRQVTNESGEVVAGYEYDPYGNPLGEHESGYGYTGEFWQSELGLLHLRARWYDPSTGTFLSKDTLESEHPYGYVRGNPVNYVDPSGHCAEMGDDTCWDAYDLLVKNYPSLKNQNYDHMGYKVPLHKLPEHRLQQLLSEPPPWSVIEESSSNVLGLIHLFEIDGYHGIDAKSRLSWLFSQTASWKPYAQFNLFPDGDSGFCEELADQKHYDEQWRLDPNSPPKPTTQMGHFLTATSLGFRSNWLKEDMYLRFAIGHEMVGDNGVIGNFQQAWDYTAEAGNRFRRAVVYDELKMPQYRDAELRAILVGTDPEFQNKDAIPDRPGNSMADLRNSLKGWRFGQAIQNGQIGSRQDAVNWLRREVYDPNRTGR